MYLIDIEARNSTLEGRGVFALHNIKNGEVAWKFEPTHDKTLSPTEFEKLDIVTQTALLRVAYLSHSSNIWVYPPENDPARFTNHSESNNLSMIMDITISPEPFFRANRDIAAGEELTVNYLEFDARSQDKVLDWEQKTT